MASARFPSPEWLDTLHQKLNEDARYGAVARKWEGDLFFDMRPDGNLAEALSAYLDLWHGTCRRVLYGIPLENVPRPRFVPTSGYLNFTAVLLGKIDPMTAMLMRRMKVDGNLGYMMRQWSTVLDLVRGGIRRSVAYRKGRPPCLSMDPRRPYRHTRWSRYLGSGYVPKAGTGRAADRRTRRAGGGCRAGWGERRSVFRDLLRPRHDCWRHWTWRSDGLQEPEGHCRPRIDQACSGRSSRFGLVRSGANRALRQHNEARVLHELGTACGAKYAEYLGAMPAKYFHQGVFEPVDDVSVEAMTGRLLAGHSTCRGCVIARGRVMRLEVGRKHRGPEYETISSFGPNLLVSDLETKARLGEACDRHGMDTINLGNSIGLAFRLFEMGKITRRETGGADLRWDDADAALRLI